MSSPTTRDVSSIAGNAPSDIKEIFLRPMEVLKMLSDDDSKPQGFGATFMTDLLVTEISLRGKVEEPSRNEAFVICTLVVSEDMLNGGMSVHGGCSAFLVDVCSTFPIIVYGLNYSQRFLMSVSQSINMTYHSPAFLGDELKIVSSTMTIGAKSMTARCEIWNATHKRLVASGVHVKMEPSQPKL